MSEKDIIIECAKEVSKNIAKEAYQDGGKPVLKPTSELLGLIPRTIKAMLLPLEKSSKMFLLNKLCHPKHI